MKSRAKIALKILLMLLILSLNLPLISADGDSWPFTLELDPAQTRIQFKLGAVFHKVHGTFRLLRGTVHFNPSTGTASGLVLVDATSGASGNRGRDKKMHSKVLESQRYPEIQFLPTGIKGSFSPQGDSRLELHGVLTLHGSEHEINLLAQVHVEGDEVTARLKIKIPYVKWGLKNPSTFIFRAGKKVELSLHVAGHLSRSSPSAMPHPQRTHLTSGLR